MLTLLLSSIAVSSLAFAQDAEPPAPVGYVRFAHLSSDAGPIKVFVNEPTARISGLRANAFTRWLEVTPGTFEISFGTASSVASALVSDYRLDIGEGDYITLPLIGNATDGYSTVAISEDFSPIAEGQARVTVFHAVPAAGDVNLLLNGNAVAQQLGYPGA
ncbi:MAG: DUF4397 domain-containing protein, partial [Armatimonadetes bacterium]|nr:DUF4397 domain-containing protein [Anaerolineae bacterium]